MAGRGHQPLVSSDGCSSPHETTARSEPRVSSDGSSYAAPSVVLVLDTRIACVNDNAIASERCQRARVSRNISSAVSSRLHYWKYYWPYKGPVVWQQLNEWSVERTDARARYERYKSCRTFAEASAAGMRRNDRIQDVRRGYVKADVFFDSGLDTSCSALRGDQQWGL